MNKTLISCLAIAATTLFFTAPVSAGTSNDLKMCRTALTEKGQFDKSLHRLKFSHRKGNSRKRTIYLTLKNKGDASRQQVSCKLDRNAVTDLIVVPKT